MLKKKLLFLFMVIVFSITLLGSISKLFGDEKPKVVVVLQNLDSEYWNVVKAGAEKGFQDFNIDGKVVAPGNKSKRDVLEFTLKSILKEKPDVLVVSPNTSPAVMSVLKKVVEHKIPVLLVDTDIPLEHKTSYIGTNNLELGRIAGALLASELQPGDKVAFPLGADEVIHPVLGERIKGAKSSLEAAGIKIVEEHVKPSNDSSPTKKAMTTILRKHPDVKGVFTTMDRNALPALEVIQDYGLKMPMTGADGFIKMLKLIEDGTLTSTITQNPYDMGYLSVETALKVINGEEVDKNIDTGVDIITTDNAKLRLDFLNEMKIEPEF